MTSAEIDLSCFMLSSILHSYDYFPKSVICIQYAHFSGSSWRHSHFFHYLFSIFPVIKYWVQCMLGKLWTISNPPIYPRHPHSCSCFLVSLSPDPLLLSTGCSVLSLPFAKVMNRSKFLVKVGVRSSYLSHIGSIHGFLFSVDGSCPFHFVLISFHILIIYSNFRWRTLNYNIKGQNCSKFICKDLIFLANILESVNTSPQKVV
jgi:hypothetical protein